MQSFREFVRKCPAELKAVKISAKLCGHININVFTYWCAYGSAFEQ